MKIGIDFDNTIVCYDEAIRVLAKERLEMPPEAYKDKLTIRDYLRSEGRENEWTAFQGELYGPGMELARPFEGAIEAMQELVSQGHELMILSHRSRKPYAGKEYDLHSAARYWVKTRLEAEGIFNEPSAVVEFLETKEEKIARVSELACFAFIDDLPEILDSPRFPIDVVKILFDPTERHGNKTQYKRVKHWVELHEVLTL